MTYPTASFGNEPNEPVLTVTGPSTPTTPLTPTPRTDAPDYGTDQASMKDKAADSAQAGKDAAGEVAQTAVDKAKTVAEETQRQARDLVTEARSQASNEAARHQRNAATNLHSLGDELSAMAQHGEPSGVASELAAQGGQRAHDLATWLDEREPGDLLDGVRNFARRRPGTFLLGALAAGVLAGRLTRGAVAAHRDSDDADSGPQPEPSTPLAPPSVPLPHERSVGGYPL